MGARGRLGRAVGCALLLLLPVTACGEGGGGGGDGERTSRDPKDPSASAPWRKSTDPVPTGGLVWASGSTVHLSDGSTIDTESPVAMFVVAGDGVFFVPGKDPDSTRGVTTTKKLFFADRDGKVSGTGLDVMLGSLRASPDGRFLVAFDRSSGPEDRFGFRQAQTVIFDLRTGRQVVRSDAGHGDPEKDDLEAQYDDGEPQIRVVTDDKVYVEAGAGYAYALPSGRRSSAENGPPDDVLQRLDSDTTTSPDGQWRIQRLPQQLHDRLVSRAGQKVTPRTGTPRWGLGRWLDDRTVFGAAVAGPGAGTKTGSQNSSAIMSCAVPSGDCTVLKASTGRTVVFPVGLLGDTRSMKLLGTAGAS